MRTAATFAAAFVLSAAGPARATPCKVDGLPDAVTGLATRLDTVDRGALATVAQDAAKVAAAEEAPAARACAHYQAAAAHFFLSTHRADRRRHAADAVRHLLAATALAPAAMQGRQPVARLLASWGRIGRVEGWLTKVTKPVAVTLDPVGEVQLEPGDLAEWAAACGDTPSCRAAARFRLPKQALSLQLRPGRYRVTVTTACGERTETVQVKAGALPLPKAPACACRLVVRDGESALSDVEVLGPGGVTLTTEALSSDLAAVTVSAPGFLPTGVSLPAAGGALQVRLERCPVELQVFTDPPGATITGDGPAPWGPRTIAARAPGYAELKTTVDVPRPASCREARHVARVVLPRHVVVTAIAEGAPVQPARLMIDSVDVDRERFARPPGRYSYEAWHPAYGATMGELVVPSCEAGASCGAVALGVEFRVVKAGDPPTRGASRWSYVLMGLGGLSMGGGLVSGAAAFNTQGQIDDYGAREDNARSIDELVDRRNTQASLADGLVIGGAAAFSLGFIVYLATVD